MHISLDSLGPLPRPVGAAPPAPPVLSLAPAPSPSAPIDIEAELAVVVAKRKAAGDSLAASKAAAKAAAEDPAVQLAEAKLALAREEREARLTAHEVVVDKLYRDECLSRGEEMVARLLTVEGDVVLRAETPKETASRLKMTGALRERADATSDRQERERYLLEEEEQARACFELLVLSDRKHFTSIVTKYPGAWFAFGKAIVAMSSAQVALAGKGNGR